MLVKAIKPKHEYSSWNNLLKIFAVSHVMLWQEIMNYLTVVMSSWSRSCEIMFPHFYMIEKLEGVWIKAIVQWWLYSPPSHQHKLKVSKIL